MHDPVDAHKQHGHEQRKVAKGNLRMAELALKNRDGSCVVGRASNFNCFCRAVCCNSLKRFHYTGSHCVNTLIVAQISGNETRPPIVKTILIDVVAELICESRLWATGDM